jgi:hypothetical protein
MITNQEYPQQFTTVTEVELYARKLNEVSIRHRLEIESLKRRVEKLEEIILTLSEKIEMLPLSIIEDR